MDVSESEGERARISVDIYVRDCGPVSQRNPSRNRHVEAARTAYVGGGLFDGEICSHHMRRGGTARSSRIPLGSWNILTLCFNLLLGPFFLPSVFFPPFAVDKAILEESANR